MQLTPIEQIRLVINSIKRFRPTLIFQEMEIRLKGAPDQLPIPPAGFIFQTTVNICAADYLQSGDLIYQKIKTVLAGQNIFPEQCESILDFGCGSGRLSRMMRKLEKTRKIGLDCNPEVIAWCQRNFRFAEFHVCEFNPPAPLAENQFDLIIAHSVFGNWSNQTQLSWLKEFHRLLRPDGHLIFNIHGSQFYPKLSVKDKERYNAGELVTIDLGAEGTNHFNSFASLDYIKTISATDFQLLACSQGQPKNFLRQDFYLVQKM